MRDYLRQIDSAHCQSVSLTGGEPLLYFDTIKEIFSLVKPNVHKCVFTNGSLLTQKIVDYFNAKQVEVVFSHDGSVTEYLRGRDVLKEPDKVRLIQQINTLTVFAVVTNKNTNVMANYRYTADKLDREDFFYLPYQVYDNSHCRYLVEGFDYSEFAKSFRQYRKYIYFPVQYISLDDEYKKELFNVTLDGKIVDKNTLEVFGTIDNTFGECSKKRDEIYKDRYCLSSSCPLKKLCKAPLENASEHYCKCVKITEGYE